MIALHHAPGSTHSAAVRIALAEKGLEYRERRLDLAAFEQHAPAFLALNSHGMVPVLEDGGRRLSESFFILLYLEETYPDPPLGGRDPRERYRVQKWGKYVETHIAPQLAVARWGALGGEVPERACAGFERLPAERRALWHRAGEGFGAERLAAASEALVVAGRRVAADLEQHEWLAADRFTLADIAVFPHLAQFDALGIALPPPVAQWLERIAARGSVRAIRSDLFPLAVMGPEAGRWG